MGLAATSTQIIGERSTLWFCSLSNHVTDGDLASSVLFILHMQSGQGNEYIESLGLFNCMPFETLFARIETICRLKFFHLWKEATKCAKLIIKGNTDPKKKKKKR